MKKLAILCCALFSFNALAEENPVKDVVCGNADFSISVAIDFVGADAKTIIWKKSRSGRPDFYRIVSHLDGEKLWEGLPSQMVEKPIGNYVALLGNEKLVLTISKPASMGGGGYSWEGTMTYFDADERLFVWGMYCNER